MTCQKQGLSARRKGEPSCDSDGSKNVEEEAEKVEEGAEEEKEGEEVGCGEGAVVAIVSVIPLVCLIEPNDVCPTRRTWRTLC